MFKSCLLLAASVLFSHIQAAEDVSTPSSMLPRKEPMQQYSSPKNSDTRSQTIAQILAAEASFTALNEALISADLIETLKEAGPFTIFAPNDKAFAKLSPHALADLLRTEGRAKLYEILTYHIVPGQLPSTTLTSGQARTLNGKPIHIVKEGEKLTVNNAQVVQRDIGALNGVIHVTDTVIMP